MTSEATTSAPSENVEDAPTAQTGVSKLFIGSLSFKTGKPSLTTAFTDLGVKVITAKVVRNNTGRSMGYGFVEIADEDVDTAVSKLHHTELDGRQINVEKATSTKPKKKTRRTTRSPNTSTNNREEGDVVSKDRPRRSTPAKREQKPREDRPPRQPREDRPPREPRTQREPRAPREPKEKQAPRPPREPRPPRAPRAPREPKATPVPREASETKLYVANIPFALTDDELAKHFSEFGNVVGKVIVNKKTLRSRGYGFVDVENADYQQKAIAEKNKSVIDGRAITVRAAYRELPVPEPSAESTNTAAANKDKPAGDSSPAPAEPKKEAEKEAPKEDKPAENKETPNA